MSRPDPIISPAIITRVKEFGESDLLVTFFTRESGLQKGVAKGARRSLKRFVNCLDAFCLASLEYTPKKQGDLCFIHSGKLLEAHQGLRSEYGSFSRASFIVELAETLFPPGVSDPRVFDLLKDSLKALSDEGGNILIPITFEARAMAIGGYRINLEKCCICGRAYKGEGRAVFVREKGGISCLGCRQESALSPGMEPESIRALRQMQDNDLGQLKGLDLSGGCLKEIKNVLKLHREYRLEKRLKTAKFLD